MRKLILSVIITLLALPVWAQTPVVIRDGTTGAEKATSAAPLRTDPTGSTTQPVSGTVSANQNGTWTVQPGNTANSTAWLVTGTGGVFPATQSGTWTVQPGNTANTTPWLFQIRDAAGNARGANVTAGNALVIDGSASTQPVSGTVTANQGGTWTVQPGNTANTTAWKVDGSAVTQPVSGTVSITANSAVNVAQVNGVTTTTGAGATGTGVQRVNDVSSSATGAAPPASGSYIVGLGSGATGGFLVGVPVCDTFKTVSMTSATTTLMVTGVSGRHVRMCSVHLVTAIANNVAMISGTGATCGTGTTGVAGGTTAANGWNFAANGGLAVGSGLGTVMQTTATGDSICLITSAAGPLAGTIAYTIY